MKHILARRERAHFGGGKGRISAQHVKDKPTARERIEPLLECDKAFEEFDMFVEHRCGDLGMAKTKVSLFRSCDVRRRGLSGRRWAGTRNP
jgi:acetyl-CoA carboxylase carboxyltransferase component